MNKQLPVSDKMIELVARRFRMLGDATRLRILQVLETRENSVTGIARALGESQPNVSKHLQSLHAVGLLTRRRAGNSILYAIADPVVFKLCALVCRSTTESTRSEFHELLAGPAPRGR